MPAAAKSETRDTGVAASSPDAKGAEPTDMLSAAMQSLGDTGGPDSDDLDLTQGAADSETESEDTGDSLAPEEASDQTPDDTEDKQDASQGDEVPETSEADSSEPDPQHEDPSEDELKAYRPKVRKRIEKLLSQRNDAWKELDAARPAVEQLQQVQPVLEAANKSGLTPDDVQTAVGLFGALARRDFKTFMEGVQPYVDIAQQYMGQRLPADLHQQVEQGRITQAHAQELARYRLQTQVQETQLAEAKKAAEQERVNAEAQKVAGSIRQAVDTWETDVKSRDPDYAMKAELVRTYSLASLQRNGPPKTADDAVSVAKWAYEQATKQLKLASPAPKATPRGPTAAQSGSAPARPEPKSMYEAAMQALANTQEG